MSVPLTGRPDPRRLEPLWDRLDRNRWLLVGYLVLFAALGAVGFALAYLGAASVLAVAAELTGVSALKAPLWLLAGGSWQETVWRLWLIGVAATAIYEWRAIAASEKRLIRRLGATIVARGELLETKMALKDMSLAGGLAVAPAVYLVDAAAVNAFVSATPGRRPVVGVTRGFVSKLTVAEQRAVFANLVARFVAGDTVVATAVTALTWPLQSWRAHRERSQNEAIDDEMAGVPHADAESDPLAALLVFGVALVFVAEVAAALHRRSQLRAGEKADVAGMLLLKDPTAMLSALEKCVRVDNVVPSAGETYGTLFYCWTGDSSNDDDDPEWRRVARLREVLGADGWVGGTAGVTSGVPATSRW